MERIGRYEIISELGRGAMGIVYKARDTKIGRDVAIKTIRLIDQAAPSETNALKERLFREAQSAGRLSHPGIVTIYDVAEESGVAYITMEFVEGRTLEEMMESGEAGKTEFIVDFLRQTAAALDYAHGKDIVHRDVKPANMMVTVEGGVKITDFGIARIVSSKLTQTGMVMGTPNYMSPEQVKGELIDGRSDQFSLSVIAYELLTGQKPFVADGLTAVIFKIASAEPTPPGEFNPHISPELEAGLLKGLSKDPKERYASCSEFAETIAASCEGLPGTLSLGRKATSFATPKTEVRPPPGTEETAPAIKIQREPPDSGEDTQPLLAPPAEKLPPLARRRSQAAEPEAESKLGFRRAWPWAAAAALLLVAAGTALWMTLSPGSLSDAALRERFPPPGPPSEIMAAIQRRVEEVPPASRTVAVNFASSQPGTRITVDGNPELSCAAPCRLEVSPGAHAAVASLPDYLEERQDFEVGLRPLGLNFEMRPIPPTLVRFASQQRGAHIVVEGKQESSCTAPCEIELRRGAYQATASLFGYHDETKDFEVGPDPLEINFDLRRLPPTSIEFTSNKEGARIVVDGKAEWSCTMPCSIPLPRGSHVALASLSGHELVRKTIDVGAQTQKVNFELRAITGSLSISSVPSGAEIYVNGRKRPETTNAIIALPPGYYLLRVQKAGAGIWEGSVALRQDEIKPLGIRLRRTPSRARLVLKTTPPGADIILNDTNRQGTTPKELDLPPGNYRVTFSLEGYRPVIREIDLTPDEPTTVDASLSRRE